MIDSNEKMKNYCDLHNLNLGETDAIKLFKILYPDSEYVIEDGAIRVKENTIVVCRQDIQNSPFYNSASIITGRLSFQ